MSLSIGRRCYFSVAVSYERVTEDATDTRSTQSSSGYWLQLWDASPMLDVANGAGPLRPLPCVLRVQLFPHTPEEEIAPWYARDGEVLSLSVWQPPDSGLLVVAAHPVAAAAATTTAASGTRPCWMTLIPMLHLSAPHTVAREGYDKGSLTGSTTSSPASAVEVVTTSFTIETTQPFPTPHPTALTPLGSSSEPTDRLYALALSSGEDFHLLHTRVSCTRHGQQRRWCAVVSGWHTLTGEQLVDALQPSEQVSLQDLRDVRIVGSVPRTDGLGANVHVLVRLEKPAQATTQPTRPPLQRLVQLRTYRRRSFAPPRGAVATDDFDVESGCIDKALRLCASSKVGTATKPIPRKRDILLVIDAGTGRVRNGQSGGPSSTSLSTRELVGRLRTQLTAGLHTQSAQTTFLHNRTVLLGKSLQAIPNPALPLYIRMDEDALEEDAELAD